jgi:cell fate (sporulation/competence/biofilm development) regulator YlbF (YheA/YmcA/DUF963 family)
MNNCDILALSYCLKDELLNSELYKNLKEKEQIMLEDKDCSMLLCAFQQLKNEYNEAKRFEKYGSDIDGVQKRLSELKYKLDENKLVRDYNLAYKEMRKKLKQIEKIVFKDIIKERKEIEIED